MNKYVVLYRGGEDNKGDESTQDSSFTIVSLNDPTEYDLTTFYKPKVVDRIEYFLNEHKIIEWKLIVSSRYDDNYFWIHKYTAIQIGDIK